MKKTKILIIAVALLTSGIMADAQNLKLDTKKSNIQWTGKKVLGFHTGAINLQSGNLKQAGKSFVGGEFVVDMNSITCSDLTDPGTNANLVGHLKSDDFFGVEKHPTAKFVLKSGNSKGTNQYEFSGDLTIKGITHPAKINAELLPDDKGVVFSGKLVVDRSKYDIRYGSGSFFQNLGDNMIYDEFELVFKVYFIK